MESQDPAWGVRLVQALSTCISYSGDKISHWFLLLPVCLERVSHPFLLHVSLARLETQMQQDQSMWSKYIALARYFKVLCLCSWAYCKPSVVKPQQNAMAFLHSLLLISERLWRASTWFRVGGKDSKSSGGAGEGWELWYSSCMKAERSQFLQHLNFELLSLCTRSLSQVLSAAGETLGVFFCLKCHSATVLNKGMRRGHTQSHVLKVMRNSSALHITRKGVFHCYLQQDCPLSVFVWLWQHHTELPCVAWFILRCSCHLCYSAGRGK